MQKYKIIEGDQKTDEWLKLREGVIITGSNAKKVKGTDSQYMYDLLAMFTSDWKPKEAYGIHIDRGNELEDPARKEYEKFTGEKVKQIAFIQNDRYGISPDGLVLKKDKTLKRLIEIKASDVNTHIRFIIENEKKIPSEHKDQIIHGFIVCDDIDEIDFISYCPAHKFKPLHIIKIKRSDLYVDIEAAKVKYSKFVEKFDENYKKIIL